MPTGGLTPKDDQEKERIKQEWQDRMEQLRLELRHLRDSHLEEDADYSLLKYDDQYKVLLEEGDLSKVDMSFEIKDRMYPSMQEIERERKHRKATDGEPDYINWKEVGRKVYIKEFDQPPEVIEAQIASMKKGRRRSEPLVIPRIKDLPSQLAEEMDIPLITRKDLEQYIGQNWIINIAVAIILVGVVIMYRYAIHLGFVPPIARLVIGTIIGGGFIYVGHYLLSHKSPVTSIVVLLATISFYYTIYLARFEYILISSWQAFGAELIVTGGGLIIAYFYNRKFLSLIATLGGYISPLVVLRETGNFEVFFIYISCFNLALIFIAYKKKWDILNRAAFMLTQGIMMLWIYLHDFNGPNDYFWLLLFTITFYIEFFVMEVVYTLREDSTFTVKDLYLFLANTVFFVWIAHFVAEGLGWSEAPLFLTILGVFHLVYSVVVYRSPNADQLLIDLLLGTTASCFALAGWFFFGLVMANSFWAFYAVLLLWLAIRTKEKILFSATVPAMGMAVVSMVQVWVQVYNQQDDHIYFILNSGFWAGMITFSAIVLSTMLLKEVDKRTRLLFFDPESYIKLLGNLLFFGTYLNGLFELLWHTTGIVGGRDFRILVLSAYHMVYILGFRWVVQVYKMKSRMVFKGTLMAMVVLSYLFYGHGATVSLRDSFLAGQGYFFTFAFHYLNVALSILIVYLLIRDIIRSEGYANNQYTTVIWFLCGMFVLHTTFELEHTILLLRNGIFGTDISAILDQVRLAGYSFLWGIVSFGFMLLGMKFKIKQLRIISLTLFGITIGKYFVFDIWRLETVWAISSTILLGVLLLIVGLQYNHLKVLVEQGELVLDRDKVLNQDEAAFMARFMGWGKVRKPEDDFEDDPDDDGIEYFQDDWGDNDPQ